jgi:hypothetical protein
MGENDDRLIKHLRSAYEMTYDVTRERRLQSSYVTLVLSAIFYGHC